MLAALSLDLTAGDLVLRLLTGLVIGFTIGLTGIGGGVLVMPTLTGLFGFPPSLAVPTANFFAVLARTQATYEHLKLNTVRRRTMFWFLVGGVPVDVAVTVMIRLNRRHGWVVQPTIEDTVRNLVVAAMVVAGVTIVARFVAECRHQTETYYQPVESFATARKVKAILCGALIGFLIGSTSVGGGVLVIPMLSAWFGLSPDNTVGTSNGISIALAFVSCLFYFAGNADVPYATSLTAALVMYVGAVPGVRVGSRLAVKVPPKVLYGIVMALILVAIVAMLTGAM